MHKTILITIIITIFCGCKQKKMESPILINKTDYIIDFFQHNSTFAFISSNKKDVSENNIPLIELSCYKIKGNDIEKIFSEQSEIMHLLSLQENFVLFIANSTKEVIAYDFTTKQKIKFNKGVANALSEDLLFQWQKDTFRLISLNNGSLWEENDFKPLLVTCDQTGILGLNNIGKLQMKDVRNGYLLWEIELSSPINYQGATIYQDKILLLTKESFICIDTKTGKILWQDQINPNEISWFSFSDNYKSFEQAYVVYGKNNQHQIKKIDLITGEINTIIKSDNLRNILIPKIINHDSIVYFTENNQVFAFEQTSIDKKKTIFEDKKDVKNIFLTQYGFVYYKKDGNVYFKYFLK